jgi:circadian clock protein KaiC
MSVASLNRMSSGISGLDVVLGGGFFKGGLYLVEGTPGTGKTTITNQICFHRIAQGERAIYVTLLAEYHSRMVQYVGRMSFFDESKLPDSLTYVSGFLVLRDEGLKALLALIRREILTKKASVLVVDGFMAAHQIAGKDQPFNEFVHEMQGIAIATDCTIFMVTSTDRVTRSTPEHTMVDGILELSDQAIGWAVQRAIQVRKIRGSDYLRGKHVYKITDDGILVHPRTEALLAVPLSVPPPDDERRVTSGNSVLDAMLGGGLPLGSPTMLLGPSGIGKTSFGLQFLAQSTAEHPGLLMGFYETPARIKVKAAQICGPLLDLFNSGTVEMIWLPPTSDSLDAYADHLLAAITRRGVRRLFFDSVGALQNAPDVTERIRLFLPALTNELRARGVTTVYSLEVGNIAGFNTKSTFGDLSVVAENLLLMRYVEKQSRLHRLISIMKTRDSDFDPQVHEFAITASGLLVDPSGDRAREIMNDQSAEDREGSSPLRPD